VRHSRLTRLKRAGGGTELQPVLLLVVSSWHPLVSLEDVAVGKRADSRCDLATRAYSGGLWPLI
jgi:hypothetical protein